MTTDAQADTRADFIQSLGITYEATFVPQSRSRNAENKERSLNWRVRLVKELAWIETDYMQGIAHMPGYETRETISQQVRRRTASENGVESSQRHAFTKKLPAPKLEDVLYSLVLDSNAYSMTFDEWAADFGYDPHSRKAHKMYMDCAEIGLKLSRIVGGPQNVERLRELFQDY